MNGIGWIQPVANARSCRNSSPRRAPTARRISPFIRRPPPDLTTSSRSSSRRPRTAPRSGSTSHSSTSGWRPPSWRATPARAAITGRLVLVQDDAAPAGAVVMYPVYRRDMPLLSVAQRRAALRGWTYAPVVASNFLADLTHGQSSDYRLRIYDGDRADARGAASTAATRMPSAQPVYASAQHAAASCSASGCWCGRARRHSSRRQRSANPLFILVGGLVFTALLALLLIVLTARRTEHIEQMFGERRFAVPALVFAGARGRQFRALLAAARPGARFRRSRRLQDEAAEVESLLRARAHRTRRLAGAYRGALGRRRRHRRSACGAATPPIIVTQLPGCAPSNGSTRSYHVRWVEPLAGNETAVGRRRALRTHARAARCAARDSATATTLTPPLNLVQGYAGFIAYLPVHRGGQFDGFIAGVFSIDDFFHGAVERRAVAQLHHRHPARGHAVLRQHRGDSTPLRETWIAERIMRIGDRALDAAHRAHRGIRGSAEILAAVAGAGCRPAGGHAGGAVGALHADLAAQVAAPGASRWRSTPASSRAARTW